MDMSQLEAIKVISLVGGTSILLIFVLLWYLIRRVEYLAKMQMKIISTLGYDSTSKGVQTFMVDTEQMPKHIHVDLYQEWREHKKKQKESNVEIEYLSSREMYDWLRDRSNAMDNISYEEFKGWTWYNGNQPYHGKEEE